MDQLDLHPHQYSQSVRAAQNKPEFRGTGSRFCATRPLLDVRYPRRMNPLSTTPKGPEPRSRPCTNPSLFTCSRWCRPSCWLDRVRDDQHLQTPIRILSPKQTWNTPPEAGNNIITKLSMSSIVDSKLKFCEVDCFVISIKKTLNHEATISILAMFASQQYVGPSILC